LQPESVANAKRTIASVAALNHLVRYIIMKLLLWKPNAHSPFEMKGWARIRSLDPTKSLIALSAPGKTKKADVAEHPEVFDHVGLLVNEPPSNAGVPFI